MKSVLFGIATILLGIAVIIAFSSTGDGYSYGTKIGLGISFAGLLFSAVGCFTNNSR
ncbi:hypothetical protein [Psychrobacillus sp. BM2]|uniref:hypothetical protein n=1 Tax=Psychrobacillus sp. BM2 TaxID=3400421 RepID=UPI003B02BDEF